MLLLSQVQEARMLDSGEGRSTAASELVRLGRSSFGRDRKKTAVLQEAPCSFPLLCFLLKPVTLGI